MTDYTPNLGLEKSLQNKPWRQEEVLRQLVTQLDDMFVGGDGIVIEFNANDQKLGFGVPWINQMYRKAKPVLGELTAVAGGATVDAAAAETGVVISLAAASEHLAGWVRVVDVAGVSVGVHVGTPGTLAGPLLQTADALYTFHVAEDNSAVITKWDDTETINGTPTTVVDAVIFSTVGSLELTLIAEVDDVVAKISFDGDTLVTVATLAGETGVEAAITHSGFFIRKDAGGDGAAGFYHLIS